MRIIYIDIESQRPDHLGCYGYHRNTTPCIDALACEGVRFDKVYAADAPYCRVASVFIQDVLEFRRGAWAMAEPQAKYRRFLDGTRP